MSLNRPLRDWHGRRVWILGASSGIGASLARELHAHGARLALSARRAGALADVAGTLQGASPLLLPLDITVRSQVLAAEQALRDAWGGYDLVVVMAGDYLPITAETLANEAAEALLAVNLRGPLYVLEAVLPTLRASRSGDIALVSSVAGYRGLPRSLVYGPSKAAIINLAEALYLELAPMGIGVWLIDPGFVATPLTANNDFPMPFLISADAAARAILRGFSRGIFEIHFPLRFTLWLRLLRLLPYRWYFPLVKKFTRS